MARHKILVIDADLASRNFVAHILRLLGHTVLLASSGTEGLTVAWRDQPDMIIADPLLSDLPGEELASRLRSDPRTTAIPLVALSKNARTARLRSWLQSGFDDYLVKSPEVVPLLQASIAELLGGGPRAARKGGLVIAFFAAKGGVGTTSLCVNLASCIGENDPGGRVVVADLVLPMGSVAEIVGYQGTDDIEAISQRYSRGGTRNLLRSSLRPVEFWDFHLLAGCPDPERAKRLNFVHVEKVVAGLRSLYEYVVLDVGRTLSRISLPLLEGADLIVITATAEHDTVRLTKTAWDYLQTRGAAASSAYLILNRPNQAEGLGKDEVESVIALPVRAALPYLGENLSIANLWHRPYCFKFPRDTTSLILKKRAQEIVELAKRGRRA